MNADVFAAVAYAATVVLPAAVTGAVLLRAWRRNRARRTA